MDNLGVVIGHKNNQYKHADEYGSYTVCFGDRTIEVKLVGFLSETLLDKFCDDLGLMLGVIEWPFWGYFGDLIECEEGSATTQDVLVNLRKRFIENGCVVEAFAIAKPKAMDSLVNLETATGLKHSFNKETLFADRLHAVEFIQNFLDKFKDKSE